MAAPPIATVFLSASIPSPSRDSRYYATADVAAIREAVVALATVVLPNGSLVFGGHPAISPLVLLIAQRYAATDRVAIYQSEFFRERVPKESLAFPAIRWIPAVTGDEPASLAVMRKAMLVEHSICAGVFIGGMEGVESEYQLFRALHPHSPAYALASTGAAARIIWESHTDQPVDTAIRTALERDLIYDGLFCSLPGLRRLADGWGDDV